MKGWRGGVGTRWEKWTSLCTKPLPVKHPITIQDGGIENLVYQALCSKITPVLQASGKAPPFLTTIGSLSNHDDDRVNDDRK